MQASSPKPMIDSHKCFVQIAALNYPHIAAEANITRNTSASTSWDIKTIYIPLKQRKRPYHWWGWPPSLENVIEWCDGRNQDGYVLPSLFSVSLRRAGSSNTSKRLQLRWKVVLHSFRASRSHWTIKEARSQLGAACRNFGLFSRILGFIGSCNI